MTTTNGDGDVTANTYDGDQLASTTVGYGTSAAATTSYTYDENGNIASITDPDGNVTSYTYDANGNVLTTTNALGTTTNTYDADGNLISTVDADGRKITYAYDGGQLMQEVWFNADGTVADTQTYTYDEDGNMLTASNSAGTYTYTYDDNQLSTQTDPNGLTLSYGYDEDGNLTTVSDSQGGVTSYVYDGNQVVSKTYQDATTQLRVNFTYDHDDNVLTETRYSDLAGTQLQGTTQYGYDGNQLTSIVQTDGSGNTLASYSYSYDAAGQLSSETDNGVTTTYVYNATGELIQAGSMIYAYDANGNPIQTGTVIGANNELLSDGTWNYTYDAAGNQIGKVNIATGETWTYVYNDANQMISAVDVSAGGSVLQQETNTYDVFGQRIGETETTGGSTTTQEFSYDTSGTLYADLDSSGTITTRYISSVTGPDEWLARVGSSGDSAWLLSDHLGSVRTVVALTGGTVLDQITFDPFGTIVSQTNPAQMGRIGFQGGQLDPITVTYGFGARNYNPGTGTWTTQDPTGLQAGSNPYEFGDNAPTDVTDPTGLAWTTPSGPPTLDNLGIPKEAQAKYAIFTQETRVAAEPAQKTFWLTVKNPPAEYLVQWSPSLSKWSLVPPQPASNQRYYTSFAVDYNRLVPLPSLWRTVWTDDEYIYANGERRSTQFPAAFNWNAETPGGGPIGIQRGKSYDAFGSLSIADMAPAEKIAEALRRAPLKAEGKAYDRLKELTSPTNLFIMLGLVGLSKALPVTEILGLIEPWLKTKADLETTDQFREATDLAVNAKTEQQINAAAEKYAEAATRQIAGLPLAVIAKAGKSVFDAVPAAFRAGVQRSFIPGTAVAGTLKDDVIVYRYWGGASPEISYWVTTTKYARTGNAKRYLALPDTNTAENITMFKIPKGTHVIIGKAEEQVAAFGVHATGHGFQIYVPDKTALIKLGSVKP